MARINGQGAPTRKTAGAIGDIYSDSTTGKRYKCTFAFKSAMDGDFDYEWREVKNAKVEPKQPFPNKDVANMKPVKTEQVEEQVETKIDIPEESEAVEETTEEPAAPKRKDYAAYSKKNN